MKKNYLRNNSGSAILISMGITAIIFTATLGISTVILASFLATGNISNSNMAFFASEGAIETAMYDVAGRGPGYEPTIGTDSDDAMAISLANEADYKFRINSRISENMADYEDILAFDSTNISLYYDSNDTVFANSTYTKINADATTFDFVIGENEMDVNDCQNPTDCVDSDFEIVITGTPPSSYTSSAVQSGDQRLNTVIGDIAHRILIERNELEDELVVWEDNEVIYYDNQEDDTNWLMMYSPDFDPDNHSDPNCHLAENWDTADCFLDWYIDPALHDLAAPTNLRSNGETLESGNITFFLDNDSNGYVSTGVILRLTVTAIEDEDPDECMPLAEFEPGDAIAIVHDIDATTFNDDAISGVYTIDLTEDGNVGDIEEALNYFIDPDNINVDHCEEPILTITAFDLNMQYRAYPRGTSNNCTDDECILPDLTTTLTSEGTKAANKQVLETSRTTTGEIPLFSRTVVF